MKPLLTQEEFDEAKERFYYLTSSKEFFTSQEIEQIEMLRKQIDDYQSKWLHNPNSISENILKFRKNKEDELHPVEFTFNEISDMCGIIALYWAEEYAHLKLSPEKDHIKKLLNKLAKIKKGIVVRNLN